jgi:hypothetical protein
VLESVADNWEATLGHGARCNRQPCESSKFPLGARPDATQDGGGSQPGERHGLAAAVLRIARRRKNLVRGVFGKIFPYPSSFEDRRLDPCVLPTPPLVGTRLSTSCLRQCA